ncbi:hypothetical protein P4I85_13780 [Bacillus cereus]|uniref:PglD-related sugar-binding protein n=1 Tax=Bacillus cereus TaxID=1396 RepID=UPI001298BC5D|nr:hypothetical protein [Bacillus cereus]MED1301979.1 hypothetical protein [Bacillus pacificus]MRC02879.1 hypothetical protein [Bacillus thuringiensis]
MTQEVQVTQQAPIEIFPFSEAPDRYKSLGFMKGNEQFIIVGKGGYSKQVEQIAEDTSSRYQMIRFNDESQNELKSIAITYYE